MPKDNILLKFNDASSFPEKLMKLVNSDYGIKYVLKEKDIVIDAVKFNEACAQVFNGFFTKDLVSKHFGQNFKKSVVFITHKHADCYVMFKILKSAVGKANCINEKLVQYDNVKSPITAVNDLIDKYAQFNSFNKSADLKNIKEEIVAYFSAKTGLHL